MFRRVSAVVIALATQHGGWRLLLTDLRPVRPGRYTLTVRKAHGAAIRRTVEIG